MMNQSHVGFVVFSADEADVTMSSAVRFLGRNEAYKSSIYTLDRP